MAVDPHLNDREYLREVQSRFEIAVKENDIESMRSFVDDRFSFVSFTDKSFINFDSFKTQWAITRESMVGTGSFTSQLNPEPAIFEGDLAVCQGNASNRLVDNNGNQFDFTSNWTVVFMRSGEEWKVLRAHNSLDPFGNPMLIHGVKKRVVKISVLAFLIGALMSSVVHYLI